VRAYTYLAGAGLPLFFHLDCLGRGSSNLTGGTRGVISFSIYIFCAILFSLEVYLFGRLLLLRFSSFSIFFVSLFYLLSTFLACLLGSELSSPC